MLATIRKALLAAAGAAGTGLGVALQDGAITQPEVGWLLGLAAAAAVGVWLVPNKDATRR
jgi:hypothetical protein